MNHGTRSLALILPLGVALMIASDPAAQAQFGLSSDDPQMKTREAATQFQFALDRMDRGKAGDEDVVRAAAAYRAALQAEEIVFQVPGAPNLLGKPWRHDLQIAVQYVNRGRRDLARPHLDRAFKELDAVNDWAARFPIPSFLGGVDMTVMQVVDEVVDCQQLAEALVDVGRVREAKTLAERALARVRVVETREGSPNERDQNEIALLNLMFKETSLVILAKIEAMRGETAAARARLDEAMSCLDQIARLDNALVTELAFHEHENLYGELAHIEAIEGRWAAARDVMDRALIHHRNRRQRYFFQVNAHSGENADVRPRGSILPSWRVDYLTGLSLGLKQADDEATAAASAAWVINGKRTEEDLERVVQRMFRLASLPETRDSIARWSANRAEAASTALGAGLSAAVRAEVGPSGLNAPTSPEDWLRYWIDETVWARVHSFGGLQSEASGLSRPYHVRSESGSHPDLPRMIRRLRGEQGEQSEIDGEVEAELEERERERDERPAVVVNNEKALSRRDSVVEWAVRVGGNDPFARNDWVSIDAARSAIADEARLIEIARFRPRRFEALGPGETPWDEPRYVAWVVPPKGAEAVEVVDLGPASAIDEAIERVRESVRPDVEDLRERGEAEVEKGAIRERLEELSKLALHPLLPHLRGAKRLIISPDGQLWLAPWSAMLLPDGRYAVEAYAIRHAETGRDLLATEDAAMASGPPVIFADPDFGPVPAAAGAGGNAPRGASFAGVPFGRLPGTAAEAEAIAPSLKAFARAEPLVFTGAAATERALRSTRSPRVLVLSTHGFSLEFPEVRPPVYFTRGSTTVGSDDDRFAVDPLALSGLVFAQANARLGAARLPGIEDGLVTAAEVEALDLRGTELVVLSACDTGLGQVRDGEGIAGLRQAFQTAGAKAVVAALWQVPDRESAQLMDDFFRRLAAGARGDDALREAQLAIIQARRDRTGGALPYFWAAFTFAGR